MKITLFIRLVAVAYLACVWAAPLFPQTRMVGISASGPTGSDFEGGMVWICNYDGSDFHPLRSFPATAPAYRPQQLLLGSDGNFYGSLLSGGPQQKGAVFRMSADGSNFQMLYHAMLHDLFEASDGYLYGSTEGLGLYSSPLVRLNKSDGQATITDFWCNGNAVEASDGRLYCGGNESNLNWSSKDFTSKGTIPWQGWLPPNPMFFGFSLLPLPTTGGFMATLYAVEVVSHLGHVPWKISRQVSADGAFVGAEFVSHHHALALSVAASNGYLYGPGTSTFYNLSTGSSGSILLNGCSMPGSFNGNFYLEDSAHWLWGRANKDTSDDWFLFRWNTGSWDCEIVRQWDVGMGYGGVPMFFLQSPLSVGGGDAPQKLVLSPNPNTGRFTFQLPEPNGSFFNITDLAGKILLEKALEPGLVQQSVRAETLPPGLYFLQVFSEGKLLAVEKFVKQ